MEFEWLDLRSHTGECSRRKLNAAIISDVFCLLTLWVLASCNMTTCCRPTAGYNSVSWQHVAGQLQDIQARMPSTVSADILMANCAWEFMVIWNRDMEALFALEQAVVYLKCIQNAILQHGKEYFISKSYLTQLPWLPSFVIYFFSSLTGRAFVTVIIIRDYQS